MMRFMNKILCFGMLAVLLLGATRSQGEEPAAEVSFSKQIAPLLIKRCQACNGTADLDDSRQALARVKAPLGFDIGSQTVPEIAVSIVATIFGAAVVLIVAPWCSVFHHLTEK